MRDEIRKCFENAGYNVYEVTWDDDCYLVYSDFGENSHDLNMCLDDDINKKQLKELEKTLKQLKEISWI